MEKLVIDRQRWVHGGFRGAMGDSALLNEEGNMCCLGFMSLACGLTKEDIEGKVMPHNLAADLLPEDMNFLLERSIINHSTVGDDFANINDSDILTDTERESRLTKLFATYGWEVSFVN